MKNTRSLLLLMLLASCGGEGNDKQELSKRLVGEWRNADMKITMNSYMNSDSTRVFEVNEQNWEQKMRMRPLHTIFNENGTYRSPHISLKDSIFYDPVGKWVIQGDTLIMQDTFPKRGLKYKYKIIIEDENAEFRGLEDCDNDGKADDEYVGRQRRQTQ
jgi:hypothetical protein